MRVWILEIVVEAVYTSGLSLTNTVSSWISKADEESSGQWHCETLSSVGDRYTVPSTAADQHTGWQSNLLVLLVLELAANPAVKSPELISRYVTPGADPVDVSTRANLRQADPRSEDLSWGKVPGRTCIWVVDLGRKQMVLRPV